MSLAQAFGAGLLNTFDMQGVQVDNQNWPPLDSLDCLVAYTFAFLPAVGFHVSSHSGDLEEDKCGGDSNV